MGISLEILTALTGILSLLPPSIKQREDSPQACVSIIANGIVRPPPLDYPYVMHGYNFDAGIEPRECARYVLETHAQHPEYNWECGDIAAVVVGLAQAHGIPARFVSGVHEGNLAGDFCLEMYSTAWNRWIFFGPKGANWFEHERDGPLGIIQLRGYDQRGYIRAEYVGGHVYATGFVSLLLRTPPSTRFPVYEMDLDFNGRSDSQDVTIFSELLVGAPIKQGDGNNG